MIYCWFKQHHLALKCSSQLWLLLKDWSTCLLVATSLHYCQQLADRCAKIMHRQRFGSNMYTQQRKAEKTSCARRAKGKRVHPYKYLLRSDVTWVLVWVSFCFSSSFQGKGDGYVIPKGFQIIGYLTAEFTRQSILCLIRFRAFLTGCIAFTLPSSSSPPSTILFWASSFSDLQHFLKSSGKAHLDYHPQCIQLH